MVPHVQRLLEGQHVVITLQLLMELMAVGFMVRKPDQNSRSGVLLMFWCYWCSGHMTDEILTILPHHCLLMLKAKPCG